MAFKLVGHVDLELQVLQQVDIHLQHLGIRGRSTSTHRSLRNHPSLSEAPSIRAKAIFSPPFSFDAFQEFLRKDGLIAKTHRAVVTL